MNGRRTYPHNTPELRQRATRLWNNSGAVLLNVDVLQIDRSYQKGLRPRLVQRIARDFDPAAFGAVVAARRDEGAYYLTDGQHRVSAVRDELGWQGQYVPAIVQRHASVEDEARIFEKINGAQNRSQAKALEDFRALLRAGDGRVREIARVVDEAGVTLRFDVGGHPQPGETRAAEALQRVYRVYGAQVLHDALILIRRTYGANTGSALGAKYIGGFALFVKTYPGADTSHLVHRLRGKPFEDFNIDASGFQRVPGSNGERAVAEAIRFTYNWKLQEGANRLPDRVWGK